LRYADFSEALLPKVDFRPHRKSKRSTQLQGAIFTWAQLQGADLYGAELQGADLMGAQLQGANLYGAELKGADLREAQLDHAILAGLQFGKLNTELAEDIITALNAISWNAISWNAIIERAIARLQVATERSTNWEGAEGEKIIIDPNDQALKHVFDESDKRLTYIDTGTLSVDDFFERREGSDSDLLLRLKYLVELSCNDKWVAGNLIRHKFNSLLASCLLRYKENTGTKNHRCPVMASADDQWINELKEVASQRRDAGADTACPF
jgi:hypothetical protein